MMNDSMRILVGVAAGALLMTGCAKPPPPAPAASTDASPAAEAPAPAAEAPRVTALVALSPTKGHKTSGVLNFEVSPGGVILVTGMISGLTPGAEHGFHVHDKGDCSAPDAASAGAHYNPDGTEHGDPAAAVHHAGDMTNIKADDAGNAMVKAELTGVTLRDGGPRDILGKGIIVHEKNDDYKSQPAGNSGARLACGAIM